MTSILYLPLLAANLTLMQGSTRYDPPSSPPSLFDIACTKVDFMHIYTPLSVLVSFAAFGPFFRSLHTALRHLSRAGHQSGRNVPCIFQGRPASSGDANLKVIFRHGVGESVGFRKRYPSWRSHHLLSSLKRLVTAASWTWSGSRAFGRFAV